MTGFFMFMAKPNPLTWQEIKAGYMSGISETKAVWYDTSYSNILEEAPENTVLVFLGQRPTGGYSVKVREVKTDGKKIYIIAREECPKPDAMVVQVITTPFVAIKLDFKEKLPLELKLEGCGK
jgi:hypothetical protein